MSGPPCTNCGAPLEGARYEVQTKCRHCGTAQENPAVLVPGDEVMKPDGEHYQLGTVRACRGPKAIDVDFEGRLATNLAFIDLVPVLRATNDLKSGTLIFNKDVMGWVKTWTGSDAEAGSVKAKHATSGFQDSFFDRPASLADVRVPAIASAAAKRSRLDTFVARFKDDPFGASVSLFISSFAAIMIGGFVLLILSVVVAVACNR
jgi:hypothetical protein